MVLHVFISFLGGVPLCIPYGLYNGTSLGGTPPGNPGMVSGSGPVTLPLGAQTSSLPDPSNLLIFELWRPIEAGRPFLPSSFLFLSLFFLFFLSFLFLSHSPLSNSFWYRCRTPFSIILTHGNHHAMGFSCRFFSPLSLCMIRI